MFIKYVLLPEVSKDAQIGFVVLHPKKAVVALEVFDSQHEVLIVEFVYRRQAIPATSTSREMLQEEELFPSRGNQPKEGSQESQKPLKYAYVLTSRPSTPEFSLEKVIHREKSGLIVDMKWSIGGEHLFLVKNKSITMYEFDLNKHPALKAKHLVEDR